MKVTISAIILCLVLGTGLSAQTKPAPDSVPVTEEQRKDLDLLQTKAQNLVLQQRQLVDEANKKIKEYNDQIAAKTKEYNDLLESIRVKLNVPKDAQFDPNTFTFTVPKKDAAPAKK